MVLPVGSPIIVSMRGGEGAVGIAVQVHHDREAQENIDRII